MREIVRMVHGSRLYGTNIETSDYDYKGVFIPSGETILLQQEKRELHNASRDERNKPGAEDLALYSLRHFLKLLCEGQTLALDMVFTPERCYLSPPAPEWRAVQENRHRFLSKATQSAFVGYCRNQSKKYVVRKDRFRAIENACNYFSHALHQERRAPSTRLEEMEYLQDFAVANSHTNIEEVRLKNGDVVPHLSVCQLRVPLTASIKLAYETYSRKREEYGRRVRQGAEGSADWKSLMHAIRVANEALEFLETGTITFPRPEAAFLVSVRLGKVPYDEVSELIDQGLQRVEEALEASKLPEEPDWEFAEHLVCTFYRHAVMGIIK